MKDREAVRKEGGGVSDPAGRLDRPGQLRLLVVFDALLREGSVAKAAAGLGLQSPAVSRMLAQLRELYGDPLFTRTAKGLVPTRFAEGLRLRLRALAAETEQLVTAPMAAAPAARTTIDDDWIRPPLISAPPLAVRPSVLLQGQPTPDDFARKLARIGHNADPQRRLAKYIATSGSGVGRSRPLAREEAEDALAIILDGEADPVQVGALLATMQYRGVTAAEMAGFIEALRRHIGAYDVSDGHADLDWPAYLSPKLKTPPWFLHAARLVAMAGYRVLLHGHYGQGPDAGKLELAAETAGIPVCASLGEAKAALAAGSIAYLPIGGASTQIQRLFGLYSLLEMRLPLNAVVHLLNPLGAAASLLGVAMPSRRDMLRDTAMLLGARALSILGNNRDFAEFTPFRATTLFRLVDGEPMDTRIVARRAIATAPPPAAYTSREYWQAVWTGAARDEVAEAIVVDTAAAALLTIPTCPAATFEAARREAADLWQGRNSTNPR
ncbi:glycosyl transferase family protein (plasmid) [Shinella zoogloeoides]|nr:glycosyl transferase family protein [Shinella zoogloeoides]WLR95631.1 glycosyl transferase family protein [Shinella zoogloeoides]